MTGKTNYYGFQTDPSEEERLSLFLPDTGMENTTSRLLFAMHCETIRDLIGLLSFDLLRPDKRYGLRGILTENQEFEALSTCRIYTPHSTKLQENGARRFYDLHDMCRQVMDKRYDAPSFQDLCNKAELSDLLQERLQKCGVTELQQYIASVATGQFYEACTIDPHGAVNLLAICEQFLKKDLRLAVKIQPFRKTCK